MNKREEKKMKRTLALLSALLLILALTGCSAATQSSDMKRAADVPVNGGEFYGFSAELGLAEVESTADSVSLTDRKLITTLHITAETEHFAELMQWTQSKTTELGGYVQSLDSNTPLSGAQRSASLTLRIPEGALNSFTAQFEQTANITWRSLEQRDITTTYVDTQAHRDALAVEQTRLLELLEQAEDLTEVLSIESRLTDVRYELESIESTLRSYDNQVDYATVYISIAEVETLTVVGETDFWQRIGDGFLRSARGVWNGLKTIFSGLIIVLPYLLVVLLPPVIFLVIFFGVRRRRRRGQ